MRSFAAVRAVRVFTAPWAARPAVPSNATVDRARNDRKIYLLKSLIVIIADTRFGLDISSFFVHLSSERRSKGVRPCEA
jgi:hypothetical protein